MVKLRKRFKQKIEGLLMGSEWYIRLENISGALKCQQRIGKKQIECFRRYREQMIRCVIPTDDFEYERRLRYILRGNLK